MPPAYPPVQGGYPAPAYAAQAAPRTDGRAVVGLVLAISSWVVCPIITAIVALVLARQSDRDIAASGGWLEGRTLNTATRWVAWINIALMTVLIVLAVVLVGWVIVLSPETFTDGSTEF